VLKRVHEFSMSYSRAVAKAEPVEEILERPAKRQKVDHVYCPLYEEFNFDSLFEGSVLEECSLSCEDELELGPLPDYFLEKE
jgi:hypothetical protein